MHLKLMVIAAAFVLSTSAALADFAEGRDAYLEGDYQLAFTEFTYSAQEGDAKSQVGLGLLHTWGQGTPVDYVKAYAWFHMVATEVAGVHRVVRTLATTNRNYLETQMSPNAVAEALRNNPAVSGPPLENFGDMPQDMFPLSPTKVDGGVSRLQIPPVISMAE